jgi:CheY-like chemotaxis protein
MTKLFQAFSQIDSSLARKFEGTGLGLAMVKLMSELHGGSVAVSSAEGEGARFAVWLPMRAALSTSVGARIAGPREISADGTDRVALVVEHDERSAELIRLLLEAEGFSVIHAASAEDALALVAAPLSLITVDLQTPGVNGWEFLAKLRESRVLASVPVVVTSGPDVATLGLNGGAWAVLQKPISRAQLRSSLANLGLDRAREHAYQVLVVDDDPKAVEVIAAFLPGPAYSVARAFGGKEAIALAQRLRPDLILLDLMMPEVNGFDVSEALRNNPDTARIPIIVITAKQITAKDRAVLNTSTGEAITIVEKAAFNRIGFMTEVRRALLPPEGRPDVQNTDR